MLRIIAAEQEPSHEVRKHTLDEKLRIQLNGIRIQKLNQAIAILQKQINSVYDLYKIWDEGLEIKM